MAESHKLFKLLLNKSFYENHKHKLPIHAFCEFGQKLLKTVGVAYDKFGRDLDINDVMVVQRAMHPTMTTAEETALFSYLNNVKDTDTLQEDAGKLAYETMWRKEVGRRISEYGLNLIDGEKLDTTALVDMLAKVGPDFIPKDFNEPVPTDPVVLFEHLGKRGRWVLNIPYLDERVKHVSPGQFIIILARPEAGKTATIVNMIAGKSGFAAQGAKSCLLANEEGADITAGRAICCFNEVSFDEARSNPSALLTPEWDKVRKNLVFLHQPDITLTQLEFYVKTNKPDVLVIDQLDHVTVSGSFEKTTERLGAIYRKAREIASKYDCVVIAVSQASAEAEGRSVVTFANAENSKTGKAAAADLIIGIGRMDDIGQDESNEVMRHFTVSKNKISGWKGTVIAKLIQNQSRLTR